MRLTKYWIATVSKGHVLKGKDEQIVQVCHGKKAPLERIQKNDFILFYSPKLEMRGKEACQKFTAIAKVSDDFIFQVSQFEGFKPFRRKVDYFACKEVAIRALIPSLDFIKNKNYWGLPFRYGLFEISKKDFTFISTQMLEENV